MKKQHLPSSIYFCSMANFVQFSPPLLLFVGILALEGGALRGGTTACGGANVFQNGIKAIEEVLEVAAYGSKNSLVLFKAQAEEFLPKMLSQFTEWYSCKNR